MNEPTDPEVAIFAAALELPVDQRGAYLDQNCAGDVALRRQVEALLRVHDDAGNFFDKLSSVAQPTSAEGATPGSSGSMRIPDVATDEVIGQKIGRYKILEKVGEGGCGVVYVAEQTEPVRRRVALKVIKLGMDTKQVVARFEAERQALAMMDHPNIAKVLDAGTTAQGRPYFIMELVRGIKITDYCDQNSLSTVARLELFIQVCQAIQHAHQKGIIHRDIKPSNILVTLNDGVPVPKVIDFGIAKATEGRLTDATVYTMLHQFIGTPAYMSPEQAEMSSLDIDTRSDIYSLGVLLYELLAGNTPFDARELMALGIEAMRKTIREKEPVRPSARFASLKGEELTTTAKRRSVDKIKLVQQLKGDLDWIVMKCLEKNRTRRYETANGLATDIQRHLKNEPVLACPPGNFYKFQKLVRRNKLAVVAVSAVTTALLFGVVISWQAVRATKERLYDSLLDQARAILHSQSVGYRDTVFALLKQARSLDVPQRDLAELRREAMACMGDFIGVTPATWPDFPNRTWATRMQISPTGQLVAFGLSSGWTNKGMILLRQLPSGTDVALLTNDNEMTSFCFNSTGDQVISLHTPRDEGGIAMAKETCLNVWAAGPNGQWRQTEDVPFPGGAICLSSTKGLFVATCDPKSPWGNVWQLVDLKTGKSIQAFRCRFVDEAHFFPHLAMSFDGKYLAVSTVRDELTHPDFGLDLWDLNTHQLVQTFKPGIGMFVSLNFSSGGKYLACLGQGGCAIYAMRAFRQANMFKEEFTWPDNPGYWPKQISFAPGSTVVALPILQQNQLRLWDFGRNQDIAVLEEPEASREAAFAPDGRFLLTSGGWGHTRLYRLFQTPEKMGLPVHDAMETAFSPDGARIALTGGDPTSGAVPTLRVCDAMTGRILWESALTGHATSVTYSPDGRTIATGSDSGVQFRDDRSGRLLFGLGTNQIQHPTGLLRFTSDGHRLLVGDDRKIDVWAVERRDPENAGGSLEARLLQSYDPKVEYGPMPFFVLEPDDRHVICGGYVYNSYRGKVYMCDLDSPTPPRLLATNINVAGYQIWTQTPDRSHLLAVSANREVVTLDVATGKRISTFPIDPRQMQQLDWFGSLSLSPDGTKLAIVEPNSPDVDIYDPKTGRLLYSLPDQNGLATWLTWSPNSQRLAVSRSSGETAIWNVTLVEQMLAKLDLSL